MLGPEPILKWDNLEQIIKVCMHLSVTHSSAKVKLIARLYYILLLLLRVFALEG